MAQDMTAVKVLEYLIQSKNVWSNAAIIGSMFQHVTVDLNAYVRKRLGTTK